MTGTSKAKPRASGCNETPGVFRVWSGYDTTFAWFKDAPRQTKLKQLFNGAKGERVMRRRSVTLASVKIPPEPTE